MPLCVFVSVWVARGVALSAQCTGPPTNAHRQPPTDIPHEQFWYSELPNRYARWKKHGVRGSVKPLAQLPPGWLIAYNDYFAESGWEDEPRRGGFSAAGASAAAASAAAKAAAHAKERAGPVAKGAAARRAEPKAGPPPAARGGGAPAAATAAGNGAAAAGNGTAAAAKVVPHYYSVRPPGAGRR